MILLSNTKDGGCVRLVRLSEHFSSHAQPATTISPEEGVFGYEGELITIKPASSYSLHSSGS